ncbi:uncharacterized protein LOC108676281 [Hyalella azteca]|uniref:Uncharacterized protein LOC108676281 n=1 Tax=Hyalella azteca TaxID=294128 RepID=A0A8B7P160_HYAAZ|nr:uncharacterized protein LOC108676281 [Hyalella azteca]
MARVLVFLIAVVAAASAQTTGTDCSNALSKAFSRIRVGNCNSKHIVDLKTSAMNPKCKNMEVYPGTYDAAICDKILAAFFKCSGTSSGLLRQDGKFDTAVFNSQVLGGKCSANPKYQTAYIKCEADTMKNFNYIRLVACLQAAMK